MYYSYWFKRPYTYIFMFLFALFCTVFYEQIVQCMKPIAEQVCSWGKWFYKKCLNKKTTTVLRLSLWTTEICCPVCSVWQMHAPVFFVQFKIHLSLLVVLKKEGSANFITKVNQFSTVKVVFQCCLPILTNCIGNSYNIITTTQVIQVDRSYWIIHVKGRTGVILDRLYADAWPLKYNCTRETSSSSAILCRLVCC